MPARQGLIMFQFILSVTFFALGIISPYIPNPEDDVCETWYNRESDSFGGSCKSGYWWLCRALSATEVFCWDSNGHIWEE